MSALKSRLLVFGALVAILAFACATRLYGLNWDEGHHLHPDERFLAIVGGAIQFPSDPLAYFDTRRSTLSPYNNKVDGFAYGMVPLFLVRAVASWIGMATYDSIPIVGRWASALADVGTVGLVFLLGRKVYGTAVGLLGAAFLAATVLDIQLSHFFAVDTFLAFFTTLALYFAYRAWLHGGNLNFALLGLACGLALATKLSAALLAPIVLLAAAMPPPDNRPRRSWMDVLSALTIVGIAAFLVYRVGEPYSFQGPGFFGIVPNFQRFDDLDRWVRISSGEIEVPFMIQWAGTPNPRFALAGLVQWGFGPALGITALLGLGVAAVQLVRWQKYSRNLLLVVWAIINLGYFGFQFAKFLRYFLPVYPALAILAAYLLIGVLPRLAERLPKPALTVSRAVTGMVLLATVLYALAFVSIYGRTNTRVAASRWIYDNVPARSTLATEHWDDALPLRLPGREHTYSEVSMTLYDDENPEKARKLSQALDKADYLILASNRLYGSIPRLPKRYPMAIEYYRALFDGRLGFDLVERFDSNPSIFGITIDSSNAQEDFTVYDHPTVLIFKKAPRYSSQDTQRLLASVPLDQVERTKPVESAGRNGLLLSPAEWQRVQSSGTWSSLFTLDGLTTTLAAPIWLLVVEVLGLAALPLCWLLFPGLADRGYGIAKTLGVVAVAYVAWLAASIGVAPFGRGLAVAALLVLVAGSGVAVWRFGPAMLADLRLTWRRLLVVEIVFLVAFGAMLTIRYLNPDLWHPTFGGEKPMDFAYLNAVIKTPSFPPYDPWFAGGYINYYYYGFVLVAVLVHLTAVPPFVAYNLAIPTIFALTLTGAFAIGASIVAGPGGRRGLGRSAVIAGVGSALALGVLGNLDGGLQILESLWKVGGDGIQTSIPLITGLTRAIVGLGVMVTGAPRPAFDFWRSTRFIGPEDPGPIHELPYFTFLYGDLHAHMLSMPLQVAMVAIGLQGVRLLREEIVAFGGLRRAGDRLGCLLLTLRPLALLGVSGLLLGSLRTTNTWELPTYVGLVGLFALVACRPGRWTRWPIAIVAAGAATGLAYGLSSVLFAPFLARYELFYSGFLPVKTPTNPGQFLLINGSVLFLIGTYLAYRLARAFSVARAIAEPHPARLRAPVASYAAVFAPTLSLPGEGQVSPVATLLLLSAAMLWGVGYGTLGVLVLVGGIAAAVGLCRRTSRETLFVVALALAGIGALALPEIIAVKGDVGRMNTVFKFYLQSWILLAILAGPCVVMLAVAIFKGRPINLRRPDWRVWWAVAVAVLLLGTSVYPVLATRTKVPLRFEPLPPTLDGMEFMSEATYIDRNKDLDLPSDYAAIRWVMENVPGTPVILEGSAPLYHWGARFSIYTGLPAVIGWDWHQKQQRWGYQDRIEQRMREVARAYEAPDPEALWNVTRKYGVKLIVVGGLERAYYPAAGLEKFERLVGNGLEVAYQEGSVTIYRVTRS